MTTGGSEGALDGFLDGLGLGGATMGDADGFLDGEAEGLIETVGLFDGCIEGT